METIFVDGLSTDRTRLLLDEYARTHPESLSSTILRASFPAAMNLGIRGRARSVGSSAWMPTRNTHATMWRNA